METGIGNPTKDSQQLFTNKLNKMKQITSPSPCLVGDYLTYVLDFVIDSTPGNSYTTRAFEWKGFYYSILIASEEVTPRQTLFLMGDLLNATLSDHWNRDFQTLHHAVHNSKEYNYGGVTVIHNSLESAIDYARYLLIKINN